MRYNITVLRLNGECEYFPLDSDTAPSAPPDSGDWVLGGNTMTDLASVCHIEIEPAIQSAAPTHVWDCSVDYAVGLSRDVQIEGWQDLAPTVPGSGTWWALKAVVEGTSACIPKNDLYIRIANIDAFTAGASTTC